MLNKLITFFKKKKLNNLDLFEIIRLFNQLTHQNDKIYSNQEGKKYILTKFGFYPVEQFNLNLINDKLNLDNNNLKNKLNQLENQLEILKNNYDTFVTKNNKLKKLFKELYNKRNEKNLFIKILNEKNSKLQKQLTFITPRDNSLELIKQLNSLKKLNKILKEDYQKLEEKHNQNSIYHIIENNEDFPENRKEKLLEKITKMTEMMENLKKKSNNQKEQITNLINQLDKLKNANS
jgi:hypothetical protein